MATTRTCPHDGDAWVTLSGSRVRELLRAGEPPPTEYTRPEVASILVAAANGSHEATADTLSPRSELQALTPGAGTRGP
jgi:ATP sulfurylase